MKGYAVFKSYQTKLMFDADERSFVIAKVEYPAPFGSGGHETQPQRVASPLQEPRILVRDSLRVAPANPSAL